MYFSKLHMVNLLFMFCVKNCKILCILHISLEVLDLAKHVKECNKKYACKYCKKKFQNPGSLRHHENVHTGDRPFPCKFCDKKFKDPSHLKHHERTHIKDENSHKFKCDDCDKRFIQPNQLKKHKLMHTGEKPFKCDFCDKKFRCVKSKKVRCSLHSLTNSQNKFRNLKLVVSI